MIFTFDLLIPSTEALNQILFNAELVLLLQISEIDVVNRAYRIYLFDKFVHYCSVLFGQI